MANTAKIKPTDHWTAAEEAQLQSLTERKKAILGKAMEPLQSYLAGNLFHSASAHAPRLAQWLAADAQTIRDLLQPFDLRLTEDGKDGQ